MISSVVLGLCVTLVSADFRLLILHNNDLHARFDETDVYCGSCPEEYAKTNQCYGGFARMMQKVNEAKAEAKAKNIPSIFLNAGDTFQGTAYYTLYKWRIAASLVESLGFDVMTIGNHEFDGGIENLVQFLQHANTPTVMCNFNISTEKKLDLPILTPSKILNVNGTQIGVIGYLTPDTTELSDTENLQIFDEIPYIRAEAKRLKQQGVKIIIALGHSGFYRDIEIAQEIPEISLVVGGHSHTLLYSPKDKPPSIEKAPAEYPYLVTQKSGKIVPVVQAYAYAKYLGELWVTFDDNGDVTSAEGSPRLLHPSVKKDKTVYEKVESWAALLRSKLRTVKGFTRTFVGKATFTMGHFESTAANLITDAVRDLAIRNYNSTLKEWTNAPIGVFQNGGIRSILDNNKNGGAVTVEDLLMFVPFENQMYRVQYRGSTLKAALEQNFNQPRGAEYRFFFVCSGIKVVYDTSRPPGRRIESVTVLCQHCSVPQYEPLKLDEIYTVVMSDFLLKGGDTFDMMKTEVVNATKLGFTDTDAIVSYFENHGVVYPVMEGRIVVKGTAGPSSCASITKIPVYLFLLLPLIVRTYNGL